MTVDKEKLKALAESLIVANDQLNECGKGNEFDDAWSVANDHYVEATDPEVILGLLAEIERLETGRSKKERELEQELEVWRTGPACWTCGDTGDVHDITGEWRGECDCLSAQLVSANRERDQLKAENEALRKDAERYAWLRLGMGKAIVVQPDNTSTCDCGRLQVLLEQEVDEAADAGLAEVNGHG